jgi:hypothetical protein
VSSDRAPDVLGPLVGWRVWHIRPTDEGWRLFSLHYAGEPWPVREPVVASCLKSRYVRSTARIDHSRHTAPTKGCLCGIYVARELDQLRQYVVTASQPALMARTSYYTHRAIGLVHVWGNVVECSQGWRAARAYPARLWLPRRRPDGERVDAGSLADDLASYAVPVELLDAGNRYEIMSRLARRAAA